MLLTMFKYQAPGTTPWMSAHDACCKLEKLRRDSGLVDSETAHVGFGGKHPPASMPTHVPKPLPVNLGFVVEMHPISNHEKLQFQEILSTLSAENHLEMYIAFEYLAVWRNVGNGDIELDDEATNPNVFREMMRWAQQRHLSRGVERKMYM
ncbi:bromodomain protein [Babesia caballi]|uniref:Bromodomain protein n=1 Tax=Babesia caballi TaxID=5871 RepID=A0AAV4LSZ3_BABCB|nr:bromodomain protein [Babesia caballi]